jgi:hypothetical protein
LILIFYHYWFCRIFGIQDLVTELRYHIHLL